jgi:hypothetical protein
VEARSGEAIWPEMAFSLDCFASLAMTGAGALREGIMENDGASGGVFAGREVARLSGRGGPSPWIASLRSQWRGRALREWKMMV